MYSGRARTAEREVGPSHIIRSGFGAYNARYLSLLVVCR
jgi:hypothetical protein